ncbi:hypothetical protein F5883DRAFT_63347 [Diaporthe sp. PMI_573]|nr:hypothetical protein F5883DRAFT_63347 [Diaporthaceae sp. PMI_573]
MAEVIDLASSVLTVVKPYARGASILFSRILFYPTEYGPTGALLLVFGSSAVWRMQVRVLASKDDRVALDFKDATKQESNMVAVAGTILAQIAITALSLSNLSQAHWTARGFFTFSLVSSIISVYYASQQHRVLSRFLSSEEIRAWMRRKSEQEENKRWMPTKRASKSDPDIDILPSITSVLTYSAPNALLSASVCAFLVGLGIYLGFVWTNDLDQSASPSDSRAVFVTYIVSVSVCYSLYSLSDTVAIGQNDNSDVIFLQDLKKDQEPRDTLIPTHIPRSQTLESWVGPSTSASALERGEPVLPDNSPDSDPRQVFREAAKIRRDLAALDDRIAQLLENFVHP